MKKYCSKLSKRVCGNIIKLIIGVVLISGYSHANPYKSYWTSHGKDLNNSRHQQFERKINVDNVSTLIEKWIVQTGGDVSATPAVERGAVYFPDFDGNLFKVDRNTGEIIWKRRISDYTGNSQSYARATPTIHKNLLLFGDQTSRAQQKGGAGALVMAVNKHTGNLVWKTKVEEHPSAMITQSGTVYKGVFYVGVSSWETAHASFNDDIECCTFRGSMLAIKISTGKVLWKTYMAPEGFAGSAVWGSSPAIDKKRKTLYIATGNNYDAPEAYFECVRASDDNEDDIRSCLDPYLGNYFDSIVSLDLKTGEVVWANNIVPYDVFYTACQFGIPGCPDPEGPDADFGQAPILYKTKIKGKRRDLVGVGQKAGVFWSLDADTGDIVWSTQVDPGSWAGGMGWGSAYDGERIYTSSANGLQMPWKLPDGSITNAGLWTALNPATGEIVWQVANPTGAIADGAVSVANGVLYACSRDPEGKMYALDARTGEILWSYVSGGTCIGGAAIVNGEVFWGSGYAGFGSPNTSNDKFYSFELP